MNKIPIVLASDRNCAAQMYITILSAISNKERDSFYDFYCLIPNKYSKRVRYQFKQLSERFSNVKITFKNMKQAFSNIDMQIPHITTPTFYRLLIADILHQYDKVIYLDIDTIVLQDLTTLYNTNLEDNYVAGVRAASYILNYQNNKTYYDSVGLKNMDYYINAGVMIWNLKKIRNENITKHLLQMTNNTYRFMDQDIINIAFYGKIKHIDFKYNVMTSYKTMFLDNPETRNKLNDIYGEKTFQNALDNPVIIHYVSEQKPWNNKTLWLAKNWLYYAKKSPLKFKKIPTIQEKFVSKINALKQKKIVFWGASLFLEELINSRKLKHNRIIGIVDKNTKRQMEKINNYIIYAPENLNDLKPDIVISTIKHKNKEVYPLIAEYMAKNCPNIKLLSDIF